jgi:hypothetical protein
MTAGRGDPIIDGYLARLEVALGDLPGPERAHMVDEVMGRIAEARASTADESDADVFRLLERIGEPAAIAAQGRASLPASPRTGWLEVLAIAGLILVWPAGVVLLWLSRVWSTTAKLIGMLVPPGGYALLGLAAWMLLFHPDRLSCTSQYSENGKLISSNCPPLPPAAVLSVIVNLAILLWLVLPIVSTVVLATRAWRSIGRNLPGSATSTVQGASRGIGLRLGLILATLTGPVVALSIVAASVLTASANPQAPGTAGGDHAVPSVSPSPLSDRTSGIPALPNLTVSQFKRAFGDKGFSCQPPVELAGQWATACTEGSDSVVAFGSDDHTIDVVMATLVVSSQAATPGQEGQLIDTVVQGVCLPTDVGRISAWAHAHMESGGQTNIDGYHVTIADFAGNFALTINRSQ